MDETTPGVLLGDRFTPRDEITRRAALLAGGLHAAGVGAGDAVAIIVRNDTAHIEATIAAGRVGAYPVPVNWHWKADEVDYLLRDCGARFLVVHADLLNNIREAIPEGVEVLVVPTPAEILEAYKLPASAGKPAPGDSDYFVWLEQQTSLDEQLAAAPSSMIYTSGTTGRPKGVQRQPATADQQALGMQALVAAFGLRPAVRTIIPAPMYHSAPNAYTAVSFALGGFLAVMPRFEPVEFLELIERHRITHVQVVPTMFVRLLQLPEEVRNRYDVSSLEFVVHAAAPCPEDVKRRMIEWFGPVIWEYYGCTESGAVVLCGSEDWLAHPGTVGKPFLTAEVKIVDPDGNELGPWESGDVYVRMHGGGDFTYRNDDEKRQRAARGDLITCGDVGYLDDEGFLYLNDRRNDMVISGGVNIYPAEIEAELLRLPGVADCAVFGIPDPEFGEALAAHVQPEAGAALTEDAVRDHIRQHLASYKVPRVVVFEESLPREDSGKIFKRLLREPYWQGQTKRI